jgi:hypothetical protein
MEAQERFLGRLSVQSVGTGTTLGIYRSLFFYVTSLAAGHLDSMLNTLERFYLALPYHLGIHRPHTALWCPRSSAQPHRCIRSRYTAGFQSHKVAANHARQCNRHMSIGEFATLLRMQRYELHARAIESGKTPGPSLSKMPLYMCVGMHVNVRKIIAEV